MNLRQGARHRHRRIALAAAALVTWFALSGLVLNHAADLALHERPLPETVSRLFYPRALPAGIPGYRAGSASFTALDGTLWQVTGDARAVGPCAALAGAAEYGGMRVAACRDAVYVLDSRGERIERIDAGWGLDSDVLAVDGAAGELAIGTRRGAWCVDSSITALRACDRQPRAVPAAPLPGDAREALERAFTPPAIDVERFVHDLHSGRLFGSGARYAWDLFALALLALVASGTRLLFSARAARDTPARRRRGT